MNFLSRYQAKMSMLLKNEKAMALSVEIILFLVLTVVVVAAIWKMVISKVIATDPHEPSLLTGVVEYIDGLIFQTTP